ncbi:MAG: thioredoxin domain-containing protein [Saprospiraceae bacterium]|nr:thioredoxin domain-containing protein [Saprospiraceae bacterium]
MNRLQHETSPYLLQHAENPVDWHPWSTSALELAKQQDKPILVSVGYSSCHWCHVMAHESFEDPATAAYMNTHFINIKIDREERPDLDQVYMEVCQALTGSGGWPLNCFLLPDGRPFYAGTYFPPTPKHNRPSWLDLLQRIHTFYTTKKDVVTEQAGKLIEMINRTEAAILSPIDDNVTEFEGFSHQIFDQISKDFDPYFGGFKGAPKFPQTMALRYTYDYHLLTGHVQAKQHILLSLRKMLRGGIYDQLGGGFARYATDEAWLIPHFEKMLYDNALLTGLMADYIRIYPDQEIETALKQTLAWVDREMDHHNEGYFSALDADTEGEEGGFYVWTEAEIDNTLESETNLFKAFFGVQSDGNWEGKNILFRSHSLTEYANGISANYEEINQSLNHSIEKLLVARNQRVIPGLDDKQLLSWNALMITALTKCSLALNDESLLAKAKVKMQFLLTHLGGDFPQLFHSWKKGTSKNRAYLDDYAFLIESLIELYKSTGNLDYLGKAADLTEFVLEHFLDVTSGMFYFTTEAGTQTPVRKKDLYDSAVPSGNATMCQNLWLLGKYLGKPEWIQQSENMIESLRNAILRYPSSFGRWARVLLWQENPNYEVAIVGSDYQEKRDAILKRYAPGSLVMASNEENSAFPLLRNRTGSTHEALIYVCQDYTCQRPVKDVHEAQTIIDSIQLAKTRSNP